MTDQIISITLRRPGSGGYQITLWPEVVRLDGDPGSGRPGAWKSALPPSWWARLQDTAQLLVRPSRIETDEPVVVVETTSGLRNYSASDKTANDAWLLAAAIDGATARVQWFPLDEEALHLNVGSIRASAYRAAGLLVVTRGSEASRSAAPSLQKTYKRLREQFASDGTFEPVGDKWRLTRDVEFSSPSAAASVMVGRNTNGQQQWKTSDGTTFAALELG